MRYLIIVIALVALVSCRGKHASEYKLDDVKKNMSMNDVLNITGEATNREDLGTATDERGDTTHIIIWHYGNNESVTFVNSKVNDIDTDNKATREQLQHIMDSAKAVSGQTN